MILRSTAKLERIRGTNNWSLLEDFCVTLDDGRLIIVPTGFITDKASVPLGWVVKRDGKYIIDGALVHDYLYVYQQIENKWIKRKEADHVLIAICKYVGMGWFKRKAVYMAVRAGGWIYYNKRARRIRNTYYANSD